MKNAKQLREERDAKLTAAHALTDAAKTAKRELTADEATQFDTLMDEAEGMATDITRAVRAEAAAAEQAGRTAPVNSHNTSEARSVASYSLLNAVNSTLPPSHDCYRALDGVEAEMHQEAVRENRAAGGEGIKGVGIPQMLIATRDNSVTMPTQPADGKAVVEKDVRPVLDFLRPKSVLRELGVQFLTGLVGNIGMPELATGAVSNWKGEIETLDKSNQAFLDREFAPKRLGTWAVRSKQFLAQTTPAIENMLRADLERSVSQKLDRTAIDGIGSATIPLGLMNNTAVNQLTLGVNGGAFTRATMIAMVAAVMNSDIPMDSPGFLLNVNTMAALMNTRLDAGSGLFLMNSADNLSGYKAAVTTNIPGDITKGTGTNLSAAVFGDFSQLLIGQWGGLDITTDPYTRATEGQVRIIIQSFYDIMTQRAKAFAVVKDVNTTIPA